MNCKKIKLLISLVCICLLSKASTTNNVSSTVDGFFENKGQMMDMEGNPVPFVLFKTEAPSVNVWITEEGITMQTFNIRKEPLTGKELEDWELAGGESSGRKNSKKIVDWERIDLTIKDASIKKENIIKENAIHGHNNYFYPHCPNGIYGVKEYQKITIQNVYPNIDWVIYRTAETFKYDFIVHPGGDYKQIELLYHSKTPIEINENGQLAFTTNYGNLKENKPVSFYEDNEVSTKFIQNYQHIKQINGDVGYETSISFSLPLKISTPLTDLVIDPQLVWGTFHSGIGSDDPSSIDTDASGNVFTTGQTTSNNFPLQNSGTYFQGSFVWFNMIFIIKFDNSKNKIWATYYGGSGADYANFITIDNNGNVLITGNSGSNDFPVQDASTFFQGTSNGNYEVIILKFDNLGNRIWATLYGGSANDWGHSIASDNNGNVFVTGRTASSNFPTQNSGTFFQGVNAGSSNIFILKFDNFGNRLWATYYGGNGDDLANSITTDNNGNIFVVGRAYSTNFPVQNSGSYFQNNNSGNADAFILKFDNFGNRLWATYYGGSAYDEISTVCADNNGNIFLIGFCQSFNFPVQNAGTFFQGTKGGGNYDAFVLKFDNQGNRNWATFYGGNSDDFLSTSFDNIGIDNYGNVYLTFITNSNPFPHLLNSCDFGYYDNTYNGGLKDNILSIFSNNGNLLWCTYIGGDGYEQDLSLALDTNNNLFVVSHSQSITNAFSYPLINPGGGAYYDTTTNGNGDVFIAEFLNAPCLNCPPTSSSFNPTICDGDSLYAGGLWQTTTGTYYDTIVNSCGSDSIIITNLLVNSNITNTDIIASCTPVTWIDGNTYSATTNTPTFTISGGAANGCDSIVTLDLTINSFVTGTDIITSCTSITWIDGNTYSSTTNTPTFTIFGGAANGCDSVVTLDLTINTNSTSTDIITSCTPITWIDGNTYSSTTNTPTFTISGGAVNGCDSIVTLNYTFTSGSTTSHTINECEGFSITIGSNTYTTSGVYIDIVNGCDTLITNLSISDDCESVIFIPNVLSPNGDNKNDLFLVQLFGVEFISLEIYNRWGLLMFDTNNISECWDGKTTSGTNAPDGTYFYILNYKDKEQVLTKKGPLTLFR